MSLSVPILTQSPLDKRQRSTRSWKEAIPNNFPFFCLGNSLQKAQKKAMVYMAMDFLPKHPIADKSRLVCLSLTLSLFFPPLHLRIISDVRTCSLQVLECDSPETEISLPHTAPKHTWSPVLTCSSVWRQSWEQRGWLCLKQKITELRTRRNR